MTVNAVVGNNNNALSNIPYLNNVIAYLQKKVPSLVNMPPLQLRSLVLLIMQQKSHEILQEKVTIFLKF